MLCCLSYIIEKHKIRGILPLFYAYLRRKYVSAVKITNFYTQNTLSMLSKLRNS